MKIVKTVEQTQDFQKRLVNCEICENDKTIIEITKTTMTITNFIKMTIKMNSQLLMHSKFKLLSFLIYIYQRGHEYIFLVCVRERRDIKR